MRRILLFICLILLLPSVTAQDFSVFGQPLINTGVCEQPQADITLQNTGDIPLTYSLSVGGRGAAFVSFSALSITVQPGESGVITTFYDIPCDADPRTYALDVFITDGVVEQVLEQEIIVAEPTTLDLVADVGTNSIGPCQTAIYSLGLGNPSPVSDAYSLRVQGHPNAHLSKENVFLNAGENETVELRVAPDDCTQTGTFPLTLLATPEKSGALQLNLDLIITNTDIPEIAPDIRKIRTDYQASAVEVPIRNTGDKETTYALSITELPWGDVNPRTLTLAPGETKAVTLTFSPPESVPTGTYVTELQAIVQDTEIVYAKPITVRLQPPTFYERNPVLAAVLFIIVLVLIAGIIGAIIFTRSPKYKKQYAAFKKYLKELEKKRKQAAARREKEQSTRHERRLQRIAQKERQRALARLEKLKLKEERRRQKEEYRQQKIKQKEEQKRQKELLKEKILKQKELERKQREKERQQIIESKRAKHEAALELKERQKQKEEERKEKERLKAEKKLERELRKKYHVVEKETKPHSRKRTLHIVLIVLILLLLIIGGSTFLANWAYVLSGLALLGIVFLGRALGRMQVIRYSKKVLQPREHVIPAWRIGLRQLSADVKNAVDDFKLRMRKVKSAAPSGAKVRYAVDIKSNYNAFKGTATFRVSKAWLKRNNVDFSEVRIARLQSGWQRIPTKVIGETARTIELEADVKQGTYAVMIKPPKKVRKEIPYRRIFTLVGGLALVIALAVLISPETTTVKGIPPQEWGENRIHTLDLNAHFTDPDGDTLTFKATKLEHMALEIIDGVAFFTPATGWTGEEYVRFTATDGKGGEVNSNVIPLRVKPSIISPQVQPYLAVLFGLIAVILLVFSVRSLRK